MIHLKFKAPADGDSLTLGPAPWFRVAGNFIRQGPHGEIVGTFRNHHWEMKAKHYVVITCNDTFTIHFEDRDGGKTEDFGPHNQLQAKDGTIFIADEPFAKFQEETQLWHCYATENFWPSLIIKSPGQ